MANNSVKTLRKELSEVLKLLPENRSELSMLMTPQTAGNEDTSRYKCPVKTLDFNLNVSDIVMYLFSSNSKARNKIIISQFSGTSNS